MNSVEKTKNGRFLFKDVIPDSDAVAIPIMEPPVVSDEVKEARDRMVDDYRNAWKGNTNG